MRSRLSKIRKKYLTFLAEEGCRYVLGYLRERMSRGERLKPGSPLITTDFGYRLKGWGKLNGSNSRFLVTSAISASVSPVIKSVLPARPYALRAYFDSQLLIAESHGCMTHAYRQFFMGHKGDMEARYTTNKGRLTEQMTEDMRRAFEQSQAFLSTDATHDSEKDRRRMLIGMWRQQAKMYGLDPDAMITGDALDGTRDAPMQQPAAVTSAQDGGAGLNDSAAAPATWRRIKTRLAHGKKRRWCGRQIPPRPPLATRSTDSSPSTTAYAPGAPTPPPLATRSTDSSPLRAR
ncbi:MAG: hypothetical protein OXI27_01430 [Thaumarchaeota archaeon]|nr:hypothetical protein [Nitrososphaerota archaeon]